MHFFSSNIRPLVLFTALFWFVSLQNASARPAFLDYTVLQVREHDSKTFTQGFEIYNGYFYESSGLYGKSFVQRYALEGNDKKVKKLPWSIFAEGLTMSKGKLYILSWKKNLLMVANPDTLKVEKTIAYEGEGWGLCADDNYFYLSNGTSKISLRDKNTFEEIKGINVQAQGRSYDKLNELECKNGQLWANVWHKDYILQISPKTGEILAVLDLSQLALEYKNNPSVDVLNGIAYDERYDAYWITGKYWPKKYLIKITPKP